MPEHKDFMAVMGPWKNAQGPMTKEERWKNFPAYGQLLVEHDNSVPWVLEWVLSVVTQKHQVDEALLYRAFNAHDQGEPLSGGDEYHDAKTVGKEVKEWTASSKLFSTLPEPMSLRVQRAYALQYVRKTEDPEAAWPYPLKGLVEKMKHEYHHEALIFDFTERLDYLFTAVDGYFQQKRNQKEGMLEHCFRNQAPKMNAMVREWPVLGDVWDIDLYVWLEDLAEKCARKEYPRRLNLT